MTGVVLGTPAWVIVTLLTAVGLLGAGVGYGLSLRGDPLVTRRRRLTKLLKSIGRLEDAQQVNRSGKEFEDAVALFTPKDVRDLQELAATNLRREDESGIEYVRVLVEHLFRTEQQVKDLEAQLEAQRSSQIVDVETDRERELETRVGELQEQVKGLKSAELKYRQDIEKILDSAHLKETLDDGKTLTEEQTLTDLIDLAISTIEQQRVDLNDTNTRLQELSLENGRKTQQLANQIRDLRKQLADSETRHGQAIDGTNQALDLVQKYERHLEEFKGRNEKLESKMVQLQKTNASDKLEALRNMMEQQQQLNDELDRKQLTLKESQEALETVEARTRESAAAAQQELDSKRAKLAAELADIERQKAALNQQEEELESKAQQAVAAEGKIQKDREDLAQTKATTEAKIAAAEAALQAKQAELDVASASIQEREKKLQTQEEKLRSAAEAAEQRSQEAEIAQQNANIAAAAAAAATAEANNAKLQIQMEKDQLAKTKQQTEAEISELQVNAEAAQAAAKAAEAKARAAEEAARSAKKEASDAVGRLEAMSPDGDGVPSSPSMSQRSSFSDDDPPSPSDFVFKTEQEFRYAVEGRKIIDKYVLFDKQRTNFAQVRCEEPIHVAIGAEITVKTEGDWPLAQFEVHVDGVGKFTVINKDKKYKHASFYTKSLSTICPLLPNETLKFDNVRRKNVQELEAPCEDFTAVSAYMDAVIDYCRDVESSIENLIAPRTKVTCLKPFSEDAERTFMYTDMSNFMLSGLKTNGETQFQMTADHNLCLPKTLQPISLDTTRQYTLAYSDMEEYEKKGLGVIYFDFFSVTDKVSDVFTSKAQFDETGFSAKACQLFSVTDGCYDNLPKSLSNYNYDFDTKTLVLLNPKPNSNRVVPNAFIVQKDEEKEEVNTTLYDHNNMKLVVYHSPTDMHKMYDYARKIKDAKKAAESKMQTSCWNKIQQADEYRMVIFYGASGSGKTYSSGQAIKNLFNSSSPEVQVTSDYCNQLMNYDFSGPASRPKNPYLHAVNDDESTLFCSKGFPTDAYVPTSTITNLKSEDLQSSIFVQALTTDKNKNGIRDCKCYFGLFTLNDFSNKNKSYPRYEGKTFGVVDPSSVEAAVQWDASLLNKIEARRTESHNGLNPQSSRSHLFYDFKTHLVADLAGVEDLDFLLTNKAVDDYIELTIHQIEVITAISMQMRSTLLFRISDKTAEGWSKNVERVTLDEIPLSKVPNVETEISWATDPAAMLIRLLRSSKKNSSRVSSAECDALPPCSVGPLRRTEGFRGNNLNEQNWKTTKKLYQQTTENLYRGLEPPVDMPDITEVKFFHKTESTQDWKTSENEISSFKTRGGRIYTYVQPPLWFIYKNSQSECSLYEYNPHMRPFLLKELVLGLFEIRRANHPSKSWTDIPFHLSEFPPGMDEIRASLNYFEDRTKEAGQPNLFRRLKLIPPKIKSIYSDAGSSNGVLYKEEIQRLSFETTDQIKLSTYLPVFAEIIQFAWAQLMVGKSFDTRILKRKIFYFVERLSFYPLNPEPYYRIDKTEMAVANLQYFGTKQNQFYESFASKWIRMVGPEGSKGSKKIGHAVATMLQLHRESYWVKRTLEFMRAFISGEENATADDGKYKDLKIREYFKQRGQHNQSAVFACLNSRKTQDAENVRTLDSLPKPGGRFTHSFVRMRPFWTNAVNPINSDEYKWQQEYKKAAGIEEEFASSSLISTRTTPKQHKPRLRRNPPWNTSGVKQEGRLHYPDARSSSNHAVTKP